MFKFKREVLEKIDQDLMCFQDSESLFFTLKPFIEKFVAYSPEGKGRNIKCMILLEIMQILGLYITKKNTDILIQVDNSKMENQEYHIYATDLLSILPFKQREKNSSFYIPCDWLTDAHLMQIQHLITSTVKKYFFQGPSEMVKFYNVQKISKFPNSQKKPPKLRVERLGKFIKNRDLLQYVRKYRAEKITLKVVVDEEGKELQNKEVIENIMQETIDEILGDQMIEKLIIKRIRDKLRTEKKDNI